MKQRMDEPISAVKRRLAEKDCAANGKVDALEEMWRQLAETNQTFGIPRFSTCIRQ